MAMSSDLALVDLFGQVIWCGRWPEYTERITAAIHGLSAVRLSVEDSTRTRHPRTLRRCMCNLDPNQGTQSLPTGTSVSGRAGHQVPSGQRGRRTDTLAVTFPAGTVVGTGRPHC